MSSIQFRRRLIVIVLLCVAAVAAVVRQFSAPDSTVHTVSTVMMVLWLPVLGSIVGWVYGKLQRRPAAGPPGFAAGSVFTPQAEVEITLRPARIPAEDGPVPAGEHRFVLVVGHQGFHARWVVGPGESCRRGQACTVLVELLSPQLALPQLAPDTAFRMLVGDAFIGDGRMLRALPDRA